MRRVIIYIVLLLTVSCSSNQIKNFQNRKADLIEITSLIKNNYNLFQNNDDEKPRIFYVEKLANLDTNSTKAGSSTQLYRLLKGNEIKKIYISSVDEIWYSMELNQSLFWLKDYLIGYVGSNDAENLKIDYYDVSNIRQLESNWFSLVLKTSLVD